MSRFVVSGDIHGLIDIEKVVRFFQEREGEYTAEDYLIICGDVGVCGFSKDMEYETREALRKLPVTVLFVDGNHVNFHELNSLGVELWMGGKVHFVEDGIIQHDLQAFGTEGIDELPDHILPVRAVHDIVIRGGRIPDAESAVVLCSQAAIGHVRGLCRKGPLPAIKLGGVEKISRSIGVRPVLRGIGRNIVMDEHSEPQIDEILLDIFQGPVLGRQGYGGND